MPSISFVVSVKAEAAISSKVRDRRSLSRSIIFDLVSSLMIGSIVAIGTMAARSCNTDAGMRHFASRCPSVVTATS